MKGPPQGASRDKAVTSPFLAPHPWSGIERAKILIMGLQMGGRSPPFYGPAKRKHSFCGRKGETVKTPR